MKSKRTVLLQQDGTFGELTSNANDVEPIIATNRNLQTSFITTNLQNATSDADEAPIFTTNQARTNLESIWDLTANRTTQTVGKANNFTLINEANPSSEFKENSTTSIASSRSANNQSLLATTAGLF